MDTAAIGSFEFLGDQTPIVFPIMQQLRTIEREGLDGHELVQVGKRGVPVVWQTAADTNDPDGLLEDYHALSGTLQTVTNTDGSEVEEVAVELLGAVAVPMAKCVGGLSSGAGTAMVFAQWRLQPTA